MHITHSHKPESTPKSDTQYGQLKVGKIFRLQKQFLNSRLCHIPSLNFYAILRNPKWNSKLDSTISTHPVMPLCVWDVCKTVGIDEKSCRIPLIAGELACYNGKKKKKKRLSILALMRNSKQTPQHQCCPIVQQDDINTSLSNRLSLALPTPAG